MRHLCIGLGVICRDGAYLLQLRGSEPKIGAAGLIGAFGGKIEDGETPIEATCRELREETNLYPSLSDLQLIGEIDVVSDHQLEPVRISATVFCLTLSKGTEVFPKEGKLQIMTRGDIEEKLDQLTPATKAIFEKFLRN